MIGTLGEIPRRAAKAFGDRIALVDGGREFSFRDIDALSGTLARNLVERGVAPGDRVTLYAPNSWEWIVSYYGALKAGAVINPINAMLSSAEVAHVVRDCGAKTLIGSADKIAPVIAAADSEFNVIVFGPDAIAGAMPFDELVARRGDHSNP